MWIIFRIKSILRKAGDDSKLNEYKDIDDSDLPLLHILIKFPEVVKDAAETYYPNQLCDYLYDLASKFNTFYEVAPVLNEENTQKRILRLNLISATAQVLKNGLSLLGIEAPEEM